LTAEEWFAGKDLDPILISLKDGYQSPTKKNELKVKKKTNILAKGKPASSSHASSGGGAANEAEEDPEEEMSLAQTVSAVSVNVTCKNPVKGHNFTHHVNNYL